MNALPASVSARVIIPFSRGAYAPLPAQAGLRRLGLLELSPPTGIAAGSAAAGAFGGENVLLPSDDYSRPRYGCCVYVVSEDGRRALPVIDCRAWSHAPLPASSLSHPVWEDLQCGLIEAAQRLAHTKFDLNGAVTIARSWMARSLAKFSGHFGSAVLVGPENYVLCAGSPQPNRPQPATSVRPRLAEADTLQVPKLDNWRLAA